MKQALDSKIVSLQIRFRTGTTFSNEDRDEKEVAASQIHAELYLIGPYHFEDKPVLLQRFSSLLKRVLYKPNVPWYR